MRIYSRAEWGARYAAGFGAVSLPVAEVWLHHTVTAPPAHNLEAEKAAMRQIESIGQSRFGGGVSYTYAVMPSGRVFEGTGAGRRGAHTGGRNSISHAIVLVGNYDRVGPSPAQERAIADLLAHGKARGWWRAARLTGGHRDTKATGCPGNAAYARIGHINSLVGQAPAPVPQPLPEEEDDMLRAYTVQIPADGEYHSVPFPPPGRADVGAVWVTFSAVGRDGETVPPSDIRVALYHGDGRFAGVVQSFKVGRGRFGPPLTANLKTQSLGSCSVLNRGPHPVTALVELVK